MTIPLVVLSGPTAAGKTEISLALATALGGEVISADSRQVYRGLDIGTAKATAAERARVPHHLIDVVDPDDRFDVARFVELARQAIDAVQGRGALPLVVGGTGLYLRGLCGGLVPTPERDEALRTRLLQEAQRGGLTALHQRLARVDPPTASRVPVADAVRIVRALEVFELTGRPLSELQREHAFADRPYRVLWLVVDRPREQLNRRILERTQQMFARGLVEEAVALRQRYGNVDLLDTLGYREALQLADGQCDRETAMERTAARTRRYAKRQRTWLRREPVDHWLEAPEPRTVLEIVAGFRRASGAGGGPN